ncbi:DEAD/DEAH box helicase [Methanoculleus sp. 10]|jgi:DEAD/DEAH box helicase domain-containing protein|uniref:DEAD/DEAH box helicase n=1 Tax=Methanoculleus sp. 10 TaxID=430615 RepID=UPI0025DC24B3|nr:DEAD/DEAH box helicase [Methanoculleus sp. 10]
MSLESLLFKLEDNEWPLAKTITHCHRFNGNTAQYGTLRHQLAPQVKHYLLEKHIRLYSHQCDAINAVAEGRNIIITTPTASGKTLCFNVPVFDALARDPEATALYIYPTKALASDQLKTVVQMEKDSGILVHPHRVDGDIPRGAKETIAMKSRLILTNPDTLHRMLERRGLWERFFSKLRFIVIDEAHTYRGIFGTNVAYLMRRFKRICKYYQSQPAFILSSATISNAVELGETLIDGPLTLIDKDGSPHGEKYFILMNYDLKMGTTRQTVELLTECVAQRCQTICFAGSRKLVGLISKKTVNLLSKGKHPELADKVEEYRAGYSPEDRGRKERLLKGGDLLGVVSTNALELGIDVGSLDCAILSGYPGSMMSTWQQAGRAGRKSKKSLIFLIAYNNPLEMYYVQRPMEFFNKPMEKAVIDLQNTEVRRNHLYCAAYEKPINPLEDSEFLGNDLEAFIVNHCLTPLFQNVDGIWYYRAKIHESVNIRGIFEETFYAEAPNQFKETLTKSQAFREAHKGAIFFHNNDKYLVTDLNLTTRMASLQKVDVLYYTIAHVTITLDILSEESINFGEFKLKFGSLEVSTLYDAFSVVRDSGQCDGRYPLDLPPHTFDTKGIWITIARSVLNEFEKNGGKRIEKALKGIEIITQLTISHFILSDPRDIGVYSGDHPKNPGDFIIAIYDDYKGGIGISYKLKDSLPGLVRLNRDFLERCPCKDGCPACLYHSKRVEADSVSKRDTIILLSVLEKMMVDTP